MNQAKNNPKNPEPFALQKRIGSTLFKVNICFNEKSKETLENKVLRLIKNDLRFTQENITMKPLQAGWLLERGSL